MVSVLIADCMIVGPSKFYPRGYVYVKRGVIESMGEGEPDTRSSFAELVLGVQNCALLPGLAVVASPTLYALRSKLPSHNLLREDVVGPWRRLRDEIAHAAAVLGLYEASLEGITSVIAIDIFPDQVLDAYRESGLRGGILVPIDCITGVDLRAKLRPIVDEAQGIGVTVGLVSCKGTSEAIGATKDLLGENKGLAGHVGVNGIKILRYNGSTIVDEGYAGFSVLDRATLPYVGGFGITTLWPLSSPQILGTALYERTWRTWRILTGSEPLERGARADIVVLDCSGTSCIEFRRARGVAPLPAKPGIEAVLSAGEVLVDQGHHLGISSKAVERYTAILLEAHDR